MIFPIIMAGGTGSRLWPVSRESFPKQFLKLHGDKTMLQTTINRLERLELESPIVICNESHRFIAAEQLRELGKLNSNIILEPIGRNTAPAIALAAFHALTQDENADLLVLAADHVILDNDEFQKSIKIASQYTKLNKLVTFGIVPKTAETGYGYIKFGHEVQCDQSDGGFEIVEFVEKPDLQTAQSYLAHGGYLWNSGMFVFKAKKYLDELKQSRPDIYLACEQSMLNIKSDLDFIRPDAASFFACPAESIDYAVMEQTKDAVVIPLDAGWSDVGAWSSLWDISKKDEKGNVCVGDVFTQDTHNSYIFAETGLIATAGVQDIVAIQTKDTVLVTSRAEAQNVKLIVDKLKSLARSEYKLHREVYRPWGKYDSIDTGSRYQVKRITVKAGGKLSTQMHHHRSEHWIVVSGTAKVMIDKTEHLLTENQSIYIPLGATHSLENPGKIDLELIEVQVGAYLGEDDIVRFSDVYGRG
ncbi:MAG: mannose-1-phosphate guanylyltransferase/mannose-6-phosphate isomerase [Moraxella sp.]|nr:mannose-1-phosphate guanylyltransferase/mannose-6-phosphate isomerase [Moraxella sp.]